MIMLPILPYRSCKRVCTCAIYSTDTDNTQTTCQSENKNRCRSTQKKDIKMKLKISYILIFFAAIAQGVMWTNVFKMLHSDYWAYVGGIPAGIAIVGLTSRSATILPRVASNRARNAGWTLLGLLVAVEPIVLGFANYSAMYPKSIVVAGGASFVITVALVLGAVVDRSLVPATKPATKPKKPKVKQVEPAFPSFACDKCSFVGGSQAALNGHQSAHKPKAYAVEFTPIENKRK